MALAALVGVDPAVMVVPGMAGGIVLDLQLDRLERGLELGANATRDGTFGHFGGLSLKRTKSTLHLGAMDDAFQYTPRFTDIRVKPPKAGDEPETPVGLKPGERRCDWPSCMKAATARAPKSRETRDFYDFCQPHAAEYNKNWNFFAGMSEGEVRAHREDELTTGGRPTWKMQAGKASREAAAFAAKFKTGNNSGTGSWRDSFEMFGASRRAPEPEAGPGAHLGKLERKALADLDLEPGVDSQQIRMRYHDLLKRCHPDMNGGDRGAEDKLQRVLMAFRTLKKAGMA